eukprot:TRINITY_DN22252_c0_g1_i3.p1 TRINITY_DN22252_c0_g1~~TRINITY_DN22252_c0_g1_i3.p1  ORF type:complete len:388 (-),score=21.83 TRINITY_DN22252_c0_g1_i3:461-1624(-)
MSKEALKSMWFEASSEIYQWTETKRRVGHRHTSTGESVPSYEYTYSKQWVSAAVDSSSFHCSSGWREDCVDYYGPAIHNTGTIPSALRQSVVAPDFTVSMGTTYFLNGGLSGVLNTSRRVLVDKTGPRHIPGLGTRMVTNLDNRLVLLRTNTSNEDSIGDVRTMFISAHVSIGNTISVVAKKQSYTASTTGALVPWITGLSGSTSVVDWVVSGSASLSEMIAEKRPAENVLVGRLRVMGGLLLFGSLQLLTGMISATPASLASIVGRLNRDTVGCGLCCMNVVLATLLLFFTVAMAWAVARPLISIFLPVAAGVLGLVAVQVHRRWADRRQAQAAARKSNNTMPQSAEEVPKTPSAPSEAGCQQNAAPAINQEAVCDIETTDFASSV